jgi:hypothetical protein
VQLVTPAAVEEGEEPEKMEPDYEAADEKCLVRLQNFKEPIVDATTENAAEQTKTLSKDNH